ncbi:MAG: hypothetical protein WB870_16095 [Gallionellaceae bacterium]
MRTRYHVIPDKVRNGVMIFDSETGAVQYPTCWQDLIAYYYYLIDGGRIDESQILLAESMAGNKPITNMVVAISGLAATHPGFRSVASRFRGRSP